MLDRVKVMINYDEEESPGKFSQRNGIKADFLSRREAALENKVLIDGLGRVQPHVK
jgi:hypothetical protein